MRIIEAGAVAADLFAAIHAQAAAPAWSAAAFHGLLLGMGAFGLLALDDEAPIGLLAGSAAGESAEILTIAVAPAARRRGAARALMLAAEAQARRRGSCAIVLDVAADNGPARALYGALGYARVGVRPGYYTASGSPRDALVLRKSIADSP